ncbi:MAG: efflux RND transporter periplasmic adaptor subunit [Nitrospira sp.]
MLPLCLNRVLMVAPLVVVTGTPLSAAPEGDLPGVSVVRPGNTTARGIVKATTQAVIHAEVQGRVNHIPYKEGQRFTKGATLVQLDCDRYRAELSAAAAEQDGKNKTFQNNRALAKLNAVSALDLELSETEAKKAAAAVRIAELNVRGCNLIAPFAGRVVGIIVNEHEHVLPRDKLLSVLDDTRLEIELFLPSVSLTWLRRQSHFAFTVDETHQTYPAKVKEISANVDAASQTIKVIGVFETLPAEVLSGMSGSAQFAE